MGERMIIIKDRGYVWHVPASAVAANRARYYADRDEDTTYEDEFLYAMEDKVEVIDWFMNNMDFSDVADKAVLVVTPTITEPDPETWEVSLS